MNKFFTTACVFCLVLILAATASAQRSGGGGQGGTGGTGGTSGNNGRDRDRERERPENLPAAPQGFRVQFIEGQNVLTWRAVRQATADSDQEETRRIVAIEVYTWNRNTFRQDFVASVPPGTSRYVAVGYPRGAFFQIRSISAAGTENRSRSERAQNRN